MQQEHRIENLKVMESGEDYSLFETRKDKGRHIRRIYAISLFVAICFIWAYRLSHIPAYGKWAWLGLFAAELWSGFYWLFGQALRWNMLFRKTFINRLSQRFQFDRSTPLICSRVSQTIFLS